MICWSERQRQRRPQRLRRTEREGETCYREVASRPVTIQTAQRRRAVSLQEFRDDPIPASPKSLVSLRRKRSTTTVTTVTAETGMTPQTVHCLAAKQCTVCG